MTQAKVLHLAVEDELSEAVARRLVHDFAEPIWIGACYRRGGFGYLKKRIRSFNHAARVTPYLVLTDLDRNPCPPSLINEWLAEERHPQLLFRVAVREVEAWLLADAHAMAGFLQVSRALVPAEPEVLADPKRKLLELAAQSPVRTLRTDLVPPRDSIRVQGPGYNDALSRFVRERWEPERAAQGAPSLRRAIAALVGLAGKSLRM